MRFVVYKHSLVLGDNNIVTKQFIVLKHDDGNLQFTDFHRYVKSTSRIKSISDDGNKRFSYVVKFLNFIFGTSGLKSIDQLTLMDYLSYQEIEKKERKAPLKNA